MAVTSMLQQYYCFGNSDTLYVVLAINLVVWM